MDDVTRPGQRIFDEEPTPFPSEFVQALNREIESLHQEMAEALERQIFAPNPVMDYIRSNMPPPPTRWQRINRLPRYKYNRLNDRWHWFVHRHIFKDGGYCDCDC